MAPFFAETMFCLVGKYDVAYMSDMKNFKITFQQWHHLLHGNDMKMMNWHLWSDFFSTFQEMMLPKTSINIQEGRKKASWGVTNPKPSFCFPGILGGGGGGGSSNKYLMLKKLTVDGSEIRITS